MWRPTMFACLGQLHTGGAGLILAGPVLFGLGS
jgi:hypothetical protein